MWTEYSIRYIKNNKASSIFLAVISFISTVFLSFLCSLGYNLWIDHVNQIIALEGSYTKRPEPLVGAYMFVILAACISLIMMIHNAFEVPMNSRIHQLGILQSIGATPKQIRSFLLQEMMILCFVPIVSGIVIGLAASSGFIKMIVAITEGVRTYAVSFHFHIMVAIVSLLVSGLTVILSAWIPARKLSKLTPLEALGYGVETEISKMRRFHVFSKIFGIYGQLGRKSIYARRKELRTSTFSLAFAFLALTGLLNIEAISGISTQYTYFERFRDKWDMTLTISDDSFELLPGIRNVEGVRDCIAYHKVLADTTISEAVLSNELKELGISNLTETIWPDGKGGYYISVPIYILDEESFISYCNENEIEEKDVVLVNAIWDSVHSSRKHREYVPLINPDAALSIDIAGKQVVVSAYADEMPKIKEEYQQYTMSLICSEHFFETIADALPVTETVYNMYLTSAERDADVQAQMNAILDGRTDYEIASRMEEEIAEVKMRNGMKFFICAFSGVLACIGITNIFSFTLGQIFQRKKEFARYFSIGLSQNGMRKILTMEALIISFRPFLLSVLITIPIVAWALHAAEITLSEYMAKSPLGIICIFTIVVFLFIMFAYYLGGKRICKDDLIVIIKDETSI